MTLTLEDLPGHTYLHESHDHWQSSMHTIKQKGGPWGCPTCGTASMLSYRCSVCGAELSGGSTHGAQQR